MREAHAQLDRDLAWLKENREALLKEYPEMWVSIHNASLAGANKDFKALLAQVQEKGIHPAETLIRKLSTEDVIIVV